VEMHLEYRWVRRRHKKSLSEIDIFDNSLNKELSTLAGSDML